MACYNKQKLVTSMENIIKDTTDTYPQRPITTDSGPKAIYLKQSYAKLCFFNSSFHHFRLPVFQPVFFILLTLQNFQKNSGQNNARVNRLMCYPKL